jgi:CBS domain-containing protein
MSNLRVQDVMTDRVVVVRPETPYQTVVDVLARFAVSAVPVIDADNRVIGVVSEADLLHKVEFSGDEGAMRLLERWRRRADREKAKGDTAGELMTAPVVTTVPGATLREAARLMEQDGVKRLPVTGPDGCLRGIVSRRDLLRGYLRADAVIRRDVVDQVIRQVLVGEPVAIEVAVARGVVTLTGSADRRSTADIAVKLARAVDGVVDVVDQLTWEYDDTVDLRRRYVFDAELG